jgi:thiosulfate/3-mercaptopyruvate sulfurtransferase
MIMLSQFESSTKQVPFPEPLFTSLKPHKPADKEVSPSILCGMLSGTSQNLKQIFLFTILSAVCSLAQAFTLPGPIVSADWLAKNKSQVQIIEVANNLDSFMSQPGKDQTSQVGKRVVVDFGGHIEGSIMMDFSTARVERVISGKKVNFMIPSQADFQKIVQSAGVNTGKPIVLVPFGLNSADIDEALRILWQFKVYGEDNISILDGGLTGWLAEGKATTYANIIRPTGNWATKGYRGEFVATSEDVANVKASAKHKTQLVDARIPAQYAGETKLEVVRGYGRIEGAKNFAPEFMTRSANGAIYFLARKDLEANFYANGINPIAPSISYCNTGTEAASTWFILHEVFGSPSAKMYDGSLNLWTIQGRPLLVSLS